MKKMKISVFLALQFLACGSFFTENLNILRYTFAAESSAAEQLASLENTMADELTQFGAEAIEAGAETKRTKDEGKTKVIATIGTITCTKDGGA